MSKENEETLKVYDEYAKVYLETGVIHDQNNPEKAKKKRDNLQKFLKSSFSSLAPRDKIFEIGSGDGENAKFLTTLDLRVCASDVADDFIKAVKKRGLTCKKFNLLKDEFDGMYSGGLAWRVFVHFKEEDLKVAIEKIYKTLRLGGVFVFNVLNSEEHGGKEGEWVDFDNDYHMGVERYFNYYREETVDKILLDAGFEITEKKKEGGDSGKRWLVYVVKKPTGIKDELRKCIENEVLPKYSELSGHTNTHIAQVISRALSIVTKLDDVDANIVYTAAACHDLGRLVDDETHNVESAKMIMVDERLREFFTEEEIKLIADAAEDHRASLEGDPRSIYGKIISTADRDVDFDEMIRRSYDYARLINPSFNDDQVIEEARIHLREKYSPDGYGAKKVYFKDEDTVACFKRIEEVTRDPLKYREFVKEYNKKRGISA